MLKNIAKCRNISFSQCRKKSTNRNILHLRERGMFHDLFPDNSANSIVDLLNASPQCVYGGFDPTADSLHVGNLLILTNLIHWQRGGHQVIALVGGATAKIGDPSGRTTERDLLLTKIVDDNVEGVYRNIKTIFDNHEKHFWNEENDKLIQLKILNNEHWYKKISAVDLIGGAGRCLRMGKLISRTSVQTRLQSAAGMSFTEFSYQLFQAYDWFHLLQKYDCKFQVGGSDQMGNMMSGHDLITRMCNKNVYGLTLPIITTEMGDKFGKSAGNAVWLSAEKTSPFTFYQFWMRQTDTEVERMLKLFSFLSLGEIKDLMRQHHEHPEKRKAQKTLANQVTLLVHGEEGLNTAQMTTRALYAGSVASLGNLRAEQIAEIFQGATVVELLPEPGQSVLDVAMNVKCFPRIEDALRIITAGGFYINQQKVNNPNEILNNNVHRLSNNVSLLRVGKKNYYVVKWI